MSPAFAVRWPCDFQTLTLSKPNCLLCTEPTKQVCRKYYIKPSVFSITQSPAHRRPHGMAAMTTDRADIPAWQGRGKRIHLLL